MFKITRGNVLATAEVKQNAEGGYRYPVYSSQTKGDGLMGYYDEYLYEDAITWTTDGANAGTVHFRKGKFYCTNVCGVLLSDSGNANRCVAEILGSVSKKYVSYVGNPKLMNNVMAEIRICIPSVDEQKKIDSFITAIDLRIAAQRRLIEALKKYKRGVLNKVFNEIHTAEDSTVLDFSDAFALLPNNTFSRDCLTTEETGILNIHYGDILVKYGSVVDPSTDTVPHIKQGVDVSKYTDGSYLKNGDVVFADTAEDYAVGKVCEIVHADGRKILSGLHTMPFRPTFTCVPMYLGYYLNSAAYRVQVLPMIQGAKVSSISKSEIRKTKLFIPTVDRQQKIVNILSALDKRIDRTERTLAALKGIKSGLLQQLFV